MTEPIRWTEAECKLLRDLGARKAVIGALPVQAEKAALWRDLNGLRRTRPLVWINEIPWHEIEAHVPELKRQCADPFLAEIEIGLKQELYQWEHFACDMVVEPVILCPIAGGPTSVYADYGLQPHNLGQADAQDVLFKRLLHTLDDVEQIRTPRVWFDREETACRLAALQEIFDTVIPVRQRGIVHQWHTAWDMAVRWYGVEPLLMDLYEQPDLVARVVQRMCEATTQVLDQQQALGMLDVGSGNWRVGSGGLGFSDELPAAVAGRPVTPLDQWGCGNAQIFSEVSPAMHEEFSLRYERPILERFGLSYYGCCEPLHHKIHLLRQIRNLRKISLSPRANLPVAAEAIGRDYVASFKPNPAFLASDTFRPVTVEANLRESLTALGSCALEVILKDVTTIRNEPARLDQWATITMAIVEEGIRTCRQ